MSQLRGRGDVQRVAFTFHLFHRVLMERAQRRLFPCSPPCLNLFHDSIEKKKKDNRKKKKKITKFFKKTHVIEASFRARGYRLFHGLCLHRRGTSLILDIWNMMVEFFMCDEGNEVSGTWSLETIRLVEPSKTIFPLCHVITFFVF